MWQSWCAGTTASRYLRPHIRVANVPGRQGLRSVDTSRLAVPQSRVGGKEAYGLIFSIHFLNVFPVGKRPQYTDHYFSQYKKTAASHAQ